MKHSFLRIYTDSCKGQKKKRDYFIPLKVSFCFLVILFTLIHSLNAQKSEKKGLKGLLGSNVETTYDKFENSTTYRMTGNKVKIKGGVASSIIKGVVSLLSKSSSAQFSIITTKLQLESYVVDGKSNELFVILKIKIEDDRRFNVMRDESLIFLVDGKRIALSTEGSFNNDEKVSLVGGDLQHDYKTNVRYAISKTNLEKIINSEIVEFRIMQSSIMQEKEKTRDKTGTHFEGTFSKKNFKNWKDFYQKYIISTPKKS